jgi:mono/diheme cytochrome c family protein
MKLRNAIFAVSLVAGAAVAFTGVHGSAAAESAKQSLPSEVQKIIGNKPCLTCHQIGNVGQGKLGPNLRGVGSRRDKAWLRRWLEDPTKVWAQSPPDYRKVTVMPPGLLTDAEIETVADFLATQKLRVDSTKILARAKDRVAAGKQLFAAYDCATCHKVNGKGGNQAQTGPDLAGVSKRFDDARLKAWLKDPQTIKKGTFMPSFGLSDAEVGALAAYLETL